MNKCKLCLGNDADDKGSHVITYALIKSAINASGKLKRDNELSFEISSGGAPIKPFYGRKILPGDIEKIKGESLTEEEIANNINPLTVDNIFCVKCEKRFTSVEVYFNDFHIKIREKKLTQMEKEK